MKYRIKPLTDLRITLYNFTPDEITKKTELIIEQGGHSVPLYDRNCTHLVIKNDSESDYLNILENFDELPKFIISEKVQLIHFDEFCDNTQRFFRSHSFLSGLILQSN